MAARNGGAEQMLDKTNTPAPSTGTSATIIPTDAALTREVVGLVADANSLAAVVKGKMHRAIELLKARRERDPETFPAVFDEILHQITDRRRRSELKLAVVDDRDVRGEATKRQAKHITKLKTAVSVTDGQSAAAAGNDVDTDASAEAAKAAHGAKDGEEPTVEAPPTAPTAAPAADPLAAFKAAVDALDNEDDLAAAVAYLDKHARKIITPEMRLADAKAKEKAEKGEDEDEEAEETPAPAPAPKPKAKRKGAKK
jgi:hypothetical protein